MAQAADTKEMAQLQAAADRINYDPICSALPSGKDNFMDKEKRKALQETYANRHPDMGIVCWKSGDNMWIAKSKNAKVDFNGTTFQLKLGSWPNREMQAAYKANPDSFEWLMLKQLDYKELGDDHDDDLELLYMEVMDEYPAAKPMRPGKR